MTRREALTVIPGLFFVPLLKILEFVVFPGPKSPDLLIVLVICIGMTCDVWNALPTGFLIGLLEDIIGWRILGLRAISLALAAGAAAIGARGLNPDSLISRLTLSAVASIVGDAAAFGVIRWMGLPLSPSFFKDVLFNTVIWSLVLVVPINWGLSSIARFGARLFPSEDSRGRGMLA
ncbi:MAG: rod shape-determining protein MreD [Bacillota bacterium]